jgi:hypothetical protein
VISVYADDVLATHARPKEAAARLDRVLDYFGEMTLAGGEPEDLRRLCGASRRQASHPPRVRGPAERTRSEPSFSARNTRVAVSALRMAAGAGICSPIEIAQL